MNNKNNAPWWVSNADTHSIAPVVLGFVIAALIFGFQIFSWLHNGYWSPLPLESLFASTPFVLDYDSWYNSPDSWLGLNKMIRWILEKVPLSIAAIGVGYFVKFIWESSVQEYWEKNPRKMGED